MTELLNASGIEKRFEGVQALRGASLRVAEGEVHALLGENGAGKSTLGKILAGVHSADAGTLKFGNETVHFTRPEAAQRRGISILFQELDLFPHLSVSENVGIGNLRLQSGFWSSPRTLERFARPFLDEVELSVPGSALLHTLSMGQRQLVAIARALSMEAKLLILDEPTSALTSDAVQTLFRLLRKLRQSGVAMVYVSHKMEEIFAISDRITVLRDGATIASVRTENTSESELIRWMVGREASDRTKATGRSMGAPLLCVQELCTKKLRGVSFTLHRGEILGVAGLVGAGRSELLAALFGLEPTRSGSIVLSGTPHRPRSPRDSMSRGLGLVPEDRKLQGLLPRQSALHNVTLSVLQRMSPMGIVRRAYERQRFAWSAEATRLKASSPFAPVQTLSGGNQQKVLLARWLLTEPQGFLLDDPTRGIDVAAKEDVYEILERLAQSGHGILLVSSELLELRRICDRILVLKDGRASGIVPARSTSPEEILALAAGARRGA